MYQESNLPFFLVNYELESHVDSIVMADCRNNIQAIQKVKDLFVDMGEIKILGIEQVDRK